jgi:hypothetical protein
VVKWSARWYVPSRMLPTIADGFRLSQNMRARDL